MATKKYLSLERLAEYDELIKAEIVNSVSDKASASHTHTIANVTNLQATLDSKAAQTDLDGHVSDATVHITSTERSNWNSAKTHANSAHAPSNAQANQNAFSNVKVGETTVSADNPTDTLTLVAGANVTIVPDATNDKITISATDTNTTYSAGTGITLSGTTFSNSGVRGISTGTTKGAISVNTNGTTTSVPVYGLGSAAYTNSNAYDAAGAANTALTDAKAYADSVGSTIKNDLLNGAGEAYDTLKELGELIDTNTTAIDALEIVAAGKADKSHTHTIANVSGLQAALDGKANASHTHTVANITDLTATAKELNYMDGVTSNVQTQLDGKAASGHSHPVDGAFSATSTNPVQNKVINSAVTSLTSAVSANTTSINSHSSSISSLQTQLSEIVEITSAEIQALFA